METSFTTLVGCREPLQLAGMGGIGTPELAAAVTRAGGLGMLPATGRSPDDLAHVLEKLPGPVGTNFLMPFLDVSAVEAAAGRCRVVEFFYDEPRADLVALVHQGGALACWQIGSAGEARRAADAGCDLLVVQGMEAGGHVRGRVGLLPLLDAVLPVVEVPVIAAGGIGSGRSMAAALAAGAAAVRVGTRFVATNESAAHPDYVTRLVGAGPDDTLLTEAFSVFWPNAPHRVLRSCVDEAEAADDEIIGQDSFPIPRWSVSPPTRTTTGRIQAMALYAGQSVGSVNAIVPAADIVAELCRGAEALLRA